MERIKYFYFHLQDIEEVQEDDTTDSSTSIDINISTSSIQFTDEFSKETSDAETG